MSKMDRQLNSKKDKETIYEIYRACRLCGAGAGYKMPIIQNVVDLDDTEVELKQKIRECVQIEVHQDDKMPPLICELCVDKVNDFYEFLEMCRQTNKRTRLRLGLPPQSMPRGAPDAGECILGLTEPVYVNEDSDGEPVSKQRKPQSKVKVKKEPELKVKLESRILTDTRSTRNSKRAPTPPRITRNRTSSKDENISLSRIMDKSKPQPKSILKKDTKTEGNSLLSPRLKRSRDKEPVKLDTPVKKVKISIKSPPPKPSPKTSPRSKLILKPSIRPKPGPYKCSVCGQQNSTSQANSNHLRAHTATYTQSKFACNPCGLWFPTTDEAQSHHRQHKNKPKPYTCRRCCTDFKHLTSYDDHFDKNECIPWYEVPDVKCDVCWHLFPTNNLLEQHKCLGEENRPGGKCNKCNRSYALQRNLRKHELTCTAKKKGEFKIDPKLAAQLRPLQIRVSRCDPLLVNVKETHYDVSHITCIYGLDKNCTYPYISRLRIKSEPSDLDKMVDINIKEEFYNQEDYVHWDSEDSESDEEVSCLVLNPFSKKKKVDSLANLALKTIFSQKCLGKVPKKRRRVKNEKLFDSLLGDTEDDSVCKDISNIINNLNDDDDEFDGKGDDNVDGDGFSVKHDDEISVLSVSNNINDGTVLKNVDEDFNGTTKDVSNVCNDNDGSNINISSNNNNKNDDLTRIDDNINSTSINSIHDKNIDDANNKDDAIHKIDEISSKNDFDSLDSNSIGTINESLITDNTQSSDVVSENEKDIDKIPIDSDNATSLPEHNSELDESKSLVNAFSIDNSSQESKLSQLVIDLGENNSQNTENSQESRQENDNSQDFRQDKENNDLNHENRQDNDNSQEFGQDNENITENDYKNAISVIVSSEKSKSSTDNDFIDDSQLMNDLNAQIGEEHNNDNSKTQLNDNFNDKIALGDLISDKSANMDGIVDDFHFDT